VRPREQRLLGICGAHGLRSPPDLHGERRLGKLHMQRRSRLQRGRNGVRERDVACHLLDGCSRLRLRIGRFDVRELLRGSLLHQRVRAGPIDVRRESTCELQPRHQWVLGLRHTDECLRRGSDGMRRDRAFDLLAPTERVSGLRDPHSLPDLRELLGSHRDCCLRLHPQPVHRRRPHRMCRLDDAGLLQHRQADGLPLRIDHAGLHQRSVQRRRVLYERLHGRHVHVRRRNGGARPRFVHVHRRSQRLHELGPANARPSLLIQGRRRDAPFDGPLFAGASSSG